MQEHPETPLILIGDTHGYIREVEALLDRLARLDYLRGRRLAFLGDYVDRGPDSKALLELCVSLEAEGHIFICGNHDYALAKALMEPPERIFWTEMWSKYEDTTLLSYQMIPPAEYDAIGWKSAAAQLRERMPDAHLEFLLDLPLVHETKTLLLVHAGLRQDEPWREQVENLTHRRFAEEEEPRQLFSGWLAQDPRHTATKCLATGHASRKSPYISAERLMLHCGVDYGRGLTAFVQDANEIVSVGRLSPFPKTT